MSRRGMTAEEFTRNLSRPLTSEGPKGRILEVLPYTRFSESWDKYDPDNSEMWRYWGTVVPDPAAGTVSIGASSGLTSIPKYGYGIVNNGQLIWGEAPAAGINREWGYVYEGHGECAIFQISGTVFRALCKNYAGQTIKDITASFPADGDTVAHAYRIEWHPDRCEFILDNAIVAVIETNIPYEICTTTAGRVSDAIATPMIVGLFYFYSHHEVASPVSETEIYTDKDTHFTGAIAQNAKEDENLADLKCNRCLITAVNIQAKENLAFELWFWSKDTFDDTDLDVDAFIGFVEVDLATFGKQIGATNQYYLNVTDVNIPYVDDDFSEELHISLVNRSAAAKTADADGEVKVGIAYIPRR